MNDLAYQQSPDAGLRELALFAGAMSTCTKCATPKPDGAFYKRADGRQYRECSDCMKTAAKDYYLANPDYQKNKGREWREANPERVLAYRKANRRRAYLTESTRRYGITPAQFQEMFAAQDEKCATCAKPFDWGDKQTKPHIDHCHTSLKVRGLLCNRCNTVLGLVTEDKSLLSNLIEYLKCHG